MDYGFRVGFLPLHKAPNQRMKLSWRGARSNGESPWIDGGRRTTQLMRDSSGEPMKRRIGFPRRIVIIGTSGSGKTTLAEKLAALLGIDLVRRDAYNDPDDPPDDMPRHQRNGVLHALASSTNGWVLDAAPYWYEDEVYPRADLVVALDYPKPLVLWRCILRAVRRGEVRRLFDRGYALRWAWKVHTERHREIGQLSTRLGDRVVIHHSSAETENWFRSLVSDTE